MINLEKNLAAAMVENAADGNSPMRIMCPIGAQRNTMGPETKALMRGLAERVQENPGNGYHMGEFERAVGTVTANIFFDKVTGVMYRAMLMHTSEELLRAAYGPEGVRFYRSLERFTDEASRFRAYVQRYFLEPEEAQGKEAAE